MRKLLVTQRLVRVAEHGEDRDALDVRWGAFLREAGLLPVPVPSGVDPAAFAAAAGPVAGLLLTGGNDVGTVSDDPLSARRDRLETTLCDIAGTEGWPILGVCRGLQFLAVRHGMPLGRVEGHAGSRHAIGFEADSRWMARHGAREVNSYHGFAPREAGGGLRVAARAGDGVVEALEHPERRVLGVMWHPERESPFRGDDVVLFRDFFAAEG